MPLHTGVPLCQGVLSGTRMQPASMSREAEIESSRPSACLSSSLGCLEPLPRISFSPGVLPPGSEEDSPLSVRQLCLGLLFVCIFLKLPAKLQKRLRPSETGLGWRHVDGHVSHVMQSEAQLFQVTEECLHTSQEQFFALLSFFPGRLPCSIWV